MAIYGRGRSHARTLPQCAGYALSRSCRQQMAFVQDLRQHQLRQQRNNAVRVVRRVVRHAQGAERTQLPQRALVSEYAALHRRAPVILPDGAVAAHYTVARHQQRNRVAGYGGGSCTHGTRVSGTSRQLRITYRSAALDTDKGTPHVDPERRSDKMQHHIVRKRVYRALALGQPHIRECIRHVPQNAGPIVARES